MIMESGKQRFSPEPTDLRQLLEEAISISRPLANLKKTRIESRFADAMAAPALDRPKMSQVCST